MFKLDLVSVADPEFPRKSVSTQGRGVIRPKMAGQAGQTLLGGDIKHGSAVFSHDALDLTVQTLRNAECLDPLLSRQSFLLLKLALEKFKYLLF